MQINYISERRMKLLKRILRIVAFGTCLGLVLLIVQRGFQIDEEVFMHTYWIIAPAIIIGAVLVNVLYNISYQRKMRRIVALLNTGQPKEYIAEVEKLLQTAKGQGLRNLLKLNLAAGYIEIKQYDKSISLLEDLAGKRLPGSAAKMICRLNLCMSYFYTAQYEKAMSLYNESQKIFESYRSDKTYGGNIAVADILAAMRNGQYDQAERLLDTARRFWNDPRLQNAFQEIGKSLVHRPQNTS